MTVDGLVFVCAQIKGQLGVDDLLNLFASKTRAYGRLWGPIIGPSALFESFFSGFLQLFG